MTLTDGFPGYLPESPITADWSDDPVNTMILDEIAIEGRFVVEVRQDGCKPIPARYNLNNRSDSGGDHGKPQQRDR